ncbi:hypothetical protein [Amycolatopsis sp. NBC_01286]|uniref:hypothetical protein n=1 Tax=Amycolatopsis sp. NBC_01286 TaxID=2903560 RepID=UPI002E153139|nr:hypothetical protein OG570_06335 [Amycolatopsis sp. NBC_01286]
MDDDREIEVSVENRERIRLLQSAWEASADAVIGRLLDSFAQNGTSRKAPERAQDELEVHAVYEGQPVKGIFEIRTHHLKIVEGPLAGRSFKSPSGAAMAVVRHLKPDVHNNRNGWTFWTITNTGHPLQAVRDNAPRRTT